MGVDHIIDYDCPVKEELGTGKLLGLCKGRAQAEAILQVVREDGDDRPPSEIRFVRQLTTPEGVSEEEVNLQQLFDETKVIDQHEGQCGPCPANAHYCPFGCIGFVPFPILQAQEEWLLSLLPENPKSTAGLFLWKALTDFEYDGGPMRELRQEGDTFFELKKPLTRKYGGMLSRKQVTSDQVLQMMFMVGHLQPVHCVLLGLFLGMVEENLDPETMAQMMKEPSSREAVLQPVAVSGELQEQVGDMAAFLNAVRAAAVLDVHLLIDA